MKIDLTPKERQALKQQAHHIQPVVMIGQHGLTEAVLKEVDATLSAHELIKIRVLGDEREPRVQIYDALCDQLNAAPVQHIGKLLVIWRPKPTEA